MSKKKFKDTTVGQLLFGAASVINPTLGSVLQGVTSPKEAIEAITKSDAPADDKVKLQQIIFEQQNKEIQAISGVSRTETFISLEQQIERQIKI